MEQMLIHLNIVSFLIVLFVQLHFAYRASPDSNVSFTPNKDLYGWDRLAFINTTCPRFVVINLIDEGLGDMMTRLFGGIAAAHNLKATMVFYHEFWRYSNHLESGYGKIFESELGIQYLKVPLWKAIKEKYNPSEIPGRFGPDTAIYAQSSFMDKYPCNSYILLKNNCYHKFGDWCMWYIANSLQSIIRPYIDENIDKIPEYPLTKPLMSNALNVVWHIRTGDVCLHCTNASKYERLYNFIAETAGLNLKYHINNIVVHKQDSRIPLLFKNIPNVTLHTDTNVGLAIRMFRQADILVTTGSSFSNTVALFTNLHKPLVFQTLDKDSELPEDGGRGIKTGFNSIGHIREKYFIVEGRAVRLDKDWNPVAYTSDDVYFILKSNGALDRIESLSTV